MKSTKELITNIRCMKSRKDLFGEDYSKIELSPYLKEQMKEHHLKPKDLIVRLNMEKSYLYQILKGRRVPSRDFLIRFAVLIRLNVDETQRLLSIAGRQPLYPRNRGDAAIIYAITHRMSLEEYQDFIDTLGDTDE